MSVCVLQDPLLMVIVSRLGDNLGSVIVSVCVLQAADGDSESAG